MTTKIQGDYLGESGPLFKLYFKTALLTLVTLGIYRFWAKTRLRKYVWSSVSGDGDSFEYTGTGLEKFLGFLMAIVILAVYLGIVQMLLLFFGFNLFVEPRNTTQMFAQLAAIYITFFAVLPLMLFAIYRARRYKMARSRWRGIRFGMENGAWGYALRAIGYIVLNIFTLGLLTPLSTFKLEKYMADRSWYGDGKFEQNGRWQALYPGFKWIIIGVVVGVVGGILAYLLDSEGFGVITFVIAYILLILGAVYYRIYALNYMASHKVLDGQVSFTATAQTGRVVTIAIIGGLGIGAIIFVLSLVAGGMIASVGRSIAIGSVSPALLVIFAVLYAGVILVIGGLSLIWITQPIIAHVVENITVQNAEHLDSIRQRSADAGADAEGFADALDIGGAL